ncbi:MAG: type I 3-dehydroquinate dehydratase [Candidatus Omnitrophica bacterium]|nr:type I 3-dehydroquinate dehydratase [Candidatus Omnitrophota bacterium]
MKFASLFLQEGIPPVIVSLKDKIPLKAIRTMEKQGVRFVELRVDLYASWDPEHVLKEAGRFARFSSIATIRSRAEGGRWNLSERERLGLFTALLPKVDAVDIELSSRAIVTQVIREARRRRKRVLVSYHDFRRTPSLEKLNQIAREAKSLGADIVKVAARASAFKDVQTLARFALENVSKNVITLAMGSKGLVSRLLFPALGSLAVYACLDEPLAPGQPDYRSMFRLLRWIYPGG